jgi:hypothetical protein
VLLNIRTLAVWQNPTSARNPAEYAFGGVSCAVSLAYES